MKVKKIWIISVFFSITLLFVSIFLISYSSKYKKDAKNLKNFIDIYTILQESYIEEPDPRTLYKGAMEGMINSLNDPYVTFIENDSMEGHHLQDTKKGVFGGIGATISKMSTATPDNPSYVEILSSIEGAPAWKAGLQADDIILEIDEESTGDISMDVVLSRLRGKIGSEVNLKIKREESIEFVVTLVREKIEVPSIKYAELDNKIGYIRLMTFSPLSVTKMEEALSDLGQKGAKKFIIDLRGNPGGLITAAVDVTSLFIEEDEAVVVSTKARIKSQNLVWKRNKKVLSIAKDIPVIILINKGSASASEIVAGALKDHKRAYLVGETTYGKGSVQQIFDLNEKEAVKLTIARYYTPSNANIDKLGIAPDKEVIFPQFTEREQKNFTTLLKSKKIASYIQKNKKKDSVAIKAFAKQLSGEYALNQWILEYFITQEYSRKENAFIFDLEYDIQLQEAIKIMNSENIPELLKESKSVYQLQEEISALDDSNKAEEK